MSLAVDVEVVKTPCPFCGGECEQKEITLPLCRGKDSYVIVQEIPAEVCQDCGEALFSFNTIAILFEIIHGSNLPCSTQHVPIYRYNADVR